MNVKEVLDSYCVLMGRIKMRADLMTFIADQPHVLEFCVAEILQLQTRIICETLAVACLLAHGDL
jgi:hypothetical protein